MLKSSDGRSHEVALQTMEYLGISLSLLVKALSKEGTGDGA